MGVISKVPLPVFPGMECSEASAMHVDASPNHACMLLGWG